MSEPKVTLVSFTPDPLAAVCLLWEASKTDGPVPMSVDEVRQRFNQKSLEDLFWKVINQKIPIAEDIDFTFMLEGVSVSFREQMVRHRIGVRAGDNYGVDTIPDLATSSWWSQSMRIMNMGEFCDKKGYRIPESLGSKRWSGPANGREPITTIFGEGQNASSIFHNTMAIVQDAYNALVEAGVPMEDARELIPLGAQHRISWKLSLQSLLHIIGERGCWILQAGLWAPIIKQMVDELCKKVHPMFRKIVHPPCISSENKFTSCLYRLENARRVSGDDAHPTCPMFLCLDEAGIEILGDNITDLSISDKVLGDVVTRRKFLRDAQPIGDLTRIPRMGEMRKRAEVYQDLWGADPFSWDDI